jgi:arginase
VPDRLAAVLAVAMATGRVAGGEVTIYNPALDPSGSAGAALTGALARGLGRAASSCRVESAERGLQ